MSSIHELLTRTTTITFDCYGTLIDWDAGLSRSFVDIFGPRAAARRNELFWSYVAIEAEVEAGPYSPYCEVLASVIERLGKQFGWDVGAEKRGRLGELLPTWTPFADTNEALSRLKKRFRLGILSNIDRDLFWKTASQFPITFDLVVTAEDVRSYKPAAAHFDRFLEEHGGREGWLHVAQSLFHDGRPANRLGVAFAWINRYNDVVDPAVRSVADFADLKSLADVAEG